MMGPQRWRNRSAAKRVRIAMVAIELSDGHKDLKRVRPPTQRIPLGPHPDSQGSRFSNALPLPRSRGTDTSFPFLPPLRRAEAAARCQMRRRPERKSTSRSLDPRRELPQPTCRYALEYRLRHSRVALPCDFLFSFGRRRLTTMKTNLISSPAFPPGALFMR